MHAMPCRSIGWPIGSIGRTWRRLRLAAAAALGAAALPAWPGPTLLTDSLGWPQYQHDAEHSGRSGWAPAKAPIAFETWSTGSPCDGLIQGGPLIWRGRIYVTCQRESGGLRVAALDFRGSLLWKADVGDLREALVEVPAIGPGGHLVLPTGQGIGVYNLLQPGGPAAALRSLTPVLGVRPHASPTVAANGRVLLVVARGNSLYEVWERSDLLEPVSDRAAQPVGIDPPSAVAADAQGTRWFVQAGRIAVARSWVDASPVARQPLGPPDDVKLRYAAPVALAGAGGGAAFAAAPPKSQRWDLWLWRPALAGPATLAWSGRQLSQPVRDSLGRLLLVADGALVRLDPETRVVTPLRSPVVATGNPMLDAADNLYLWQDGALSLLPADPALPALVHPVPASTEEGLSGAPRLALAPDGTVWASTLHGTRLFAFMPRFAGPPDQDLSGQPLRHRAVYRVEGRITVGRSTVPAGTEVLLQAGAGLSLAPGLRVERGAGLVVRTGPTLPSVRSPAP